MGQTAKELASYLRGWKSYFGLCQTPSVLERLDAWIRRRLRSLIWKQWKGRAARYRNLRQAGVVAKVAGSVAASSLGPWWMANSPAITRALPNTFFETLGIPRLGG
ncbi:MAG TPA: group II intron maturase-specific domain-containing protein [Candidatus Angelobacter sp.]